LDLKAALHGAVAANKVFVMDQAGIKAGSSSETTTHRRDEFKAKMDAQFSAGAAGFEVWNWEPATHRNCDFTIAPDDPIMGLLRTYRLPA
jgi:hypothetical protein